MIDIHSHILPNIDDGAKSVNESISMLSSLKSQGVTAVVATPHFKASQGDRLEDFLSCRSSAYRLIADEIAVRGLDLPPVLLAAEVMLSSDIAEMPDIRRLCYPGTDYILVELPEYPWKPWLYDMLFSLAATNNITPIIAHIDRYIDLHPWDEICKLVSLNFPLQINAISSGGLNHRKKLVKLINSGAVNFIGSDCHNMIDRPPQIDEFKQKYRRLIGDDFYRYADKCSMRLINSNEQI